MAKLRTEGELIRVDGIEIELIRKNIRTLNIRVYPPDGRVKMTIPFFMPALAVTLSIRKHFEWIQKRREAVRSQAAKTGRELRTGETCRYRGRDLRLEVVAVAGKRQKVTLQEDGTIAMQVLPGATETAKAKLLETWYRAELKKAIAPLLETWTRTTGLVPREWGIKRMKTRWGTCNAQARRIWLNLELVKQPPACLEYVLVHELSHLKERGHGERFKALMDGWIPDWRAIRKRLNRGTDGMTED